MSLLKRYLRLELATLLRNNIRFQVIGRMEELGPDVQSELERAMRDTAKCSGLLFNIALNYGGRAEITDAVRRLVVTCCPMAATWSASTSACLGVSLYRRAARSRSPHPHERRDAHLNFPAVADRLCGDLGHRRPLARFSPAAPPPRPSRTTRKRERRYGGITPA
jgi:hypothetical protein